MAAGQTSGSGAMSNLNDDKVRKDDILSSRDKVQRRPDQSLDGIGVQVEEYKDLPTNQRSASGDRSKQEASKTTTTKSTAKTDRPGFDLGGSSGDTSAGKGLGLDTDANDGRKDWKLPRDK